MIPKLTGDLPTNWVNGEVLSPDGAPFSDPKRGYNYLSQKINDIITKQNQLIDFLTFASSDVGKMVSVKADSTFGYKIYTITDIDGGTKFTLRVKEVTAESQIDKTARAFTVYADRLFVGTGNGYKQICKPTVLLQIPGQSTTEGMSQKAITDAIGAIEGIPTGFVAYCAYNAVPSGFIVCNGGQISRTVYSRLFSVIGTTYGSGDGSSTFNVPNLWGRFVQGGYVGSYIEAGLPNITGYVGGNARCGFSESGAFQIAWNCEQGNKTSGDGGVWYFNAARCSSIYGNSSTVQPPALTLYPIIKY